jgi:hypothetical protein
MASATVAGLLLESILAEPPPVAGGELWVDCSNYTGNLTDQGCADLKAAGYVGVIIQAITGLDGVSYTRQQLAACVHNGLRIAGYVWCFPFAAPGSMLTRLGMFDGYRLEFLALDVEEAGTRKFDVDRDLALCDAPGDLGVLRKMVLRSAALEPGDVVELAASLEQPL